MSVTSQLALAAGFIFVVLGLFWLVLFREQQNEGMSTEASRSNSTSMVGIFAASSAVDFLTVVVNYI